MRFGERRDTSSADEDLAALRFAASLSIVFIYLLMGFLFESFILPLSIIATIPLAGIGVAWIHYALGYNLDFLGVVGIVLLIGVVVNNGIVLIDYANRLRAEGMERAEALLVADERRFRPIMMTALTTICGMVPVTLSGATSIGLSYTSFGLTLIGGLTTATLLTSSSSRSSKRSSTTPSSSPAAPSATPSGRRRPSALRPEGPPPQRVAVSSHELPVFVDEVPVFRTSCGK